MIRQGFETSAQAAVYDKVAVWMREIFGEFAYVSEDSSTIGVNVGSAFAITFVFPWSENDTIIDTVARIVSDVSLTPDLLYYLLKLNADMTFGAFGVDPEGNIIFKHTLIGSTCDKEELRTSVKGTVQIADEYDDMIVARWGGKRASDVMYESR